MFLPPDVLIAGRHKLYRNLMNALSHAFHCLCRYNRLHPAKNLQLQAFAFCPANFILAKFFRLESMMG